MKTGRSGVIFTWASPTFHSGSAACRPVVVPSSARTAAAVHRRILSRVRMRMVRASLGRRDLHRRDLTAWTRGPQIICRAKKKGSRLDGRPPWMDGGLRKHYGGEVGRISVYSE